MVITIPYHTRGDQIDSSDSKKPSSESIYLDHPRPPNSLLFFSFRMMDMDELVSLMPVVDDVYIFPSPCIGYLCRVILGDGYVVIGYYFFSFGSSSLLPIYSLRTHGPKTKKKGTIYSVTYSPSKIRLPCRPITLTITISTPEVLAERGFRCECLRASREFRSRR